MAISLAGMILAHRGSVPPKNPNQPPSMTNTTEDIKAPHLADSR